MNNGLCPQCGCEMEITSQMSYPLNADETTEATIAEIVETCPSCGYEDTYIED